MTLFGNAEIIGLTQPYGKLAHLQVTEFLAYIARISNPKNQNNHLTAPKLLRYLIREKHWSPFEMINVVMEIETTRDIARQILRHRSFSYQEFSQRYADPTEELGFVSRATRLQDVKNRQSSIETSDQALHDGWADKQLRVQQEANSAYQWALQNNIAKEVARSVLPEGMIVSRLYMNGSLRSWLHYALVRTHASTQSEHRFIAATAWRQIAEVFPALAEIEMPASDSPDIS